MTHIFGLVGAVLSGVSFMAMDASLANLMAGIGFSGA